MSPPRRSILERHGRLMARGRWVVIPLFLILLAGAVMLAGRIGDVTSDEQTLPGSEAVRGSELVDGPAAESLGDPPSRR